MYVIRVSVGPLWYPIYRCKRSKNPQIISGATRTRHNIFTVYATLFIHTTYFDPNGSSSGVYS
jgi:hypothetical protein